MKEGEELVVYKLFITGGNNYLDFKSAYNKIVRHNNDHTINKPKTVYWRLKIFSMMIKDAVRTLRLPYGN